MHAKAKVALKILLISFIVCVVVLGAVGITFYFLNREVFMYKTLNEKVEINIESFNNANNSLNQKTLYGEKAKDNPFYIIYASRNDTDKSYFGSVETLAKTNNFNQQRYKLYAPYFMSLKFDAGEQKPIKKALKEYESTKTKLLDTTKEAVQNINDVQIYNYYINSFFVSYQKYIEAYNFLNSCMLNALLNKGVFKNTLQQSALQFGQINFDIVQKYYLENLKTNRDNTKITLLNENFENIIKLTSVISNWTNDKFEYNEDLILKENYDAAFTEFNVSFKKFTTNESKLNAGQITQFLNSDKTKLAEVATTDDNYNYVEFNNFLVKNGTLYNFYNGAFYTNYIK